MFTLTLFHTIFYPFDFPPFLILFFTALFFAIFYSLCFFVFLLLFVSAIFYPLHFWQICSSSFSAISTLWFLHLFVFHHFWFSLLSKFFSSSSFAAIFNFLFKHLFNSFRFPPFYTLHNFFQGFPLHFPPFILCASSFSAIFAVLHLALFLLLFILQLLTPLRFLTFLILLIFYVNAPFRFASFFFLLVFTPYLFLLTHTILYSLCHYYRLCFISSNVSSCFLQFSLLVSHKFFLTLLASIFLFPYISLFPPLFLSPPLLLLFGSPLIFRSTLFFHHFSFLFSFCQFRLSLVSWGGGLPHIIFFPFWFFLRHFFPSYCSLRS